MNMDCNTRKRSFRPSGGEGAMKEIKTDKHLQYAERGREREEVNYSKHHSKKKKKKKKRMFLHVGKYISASIMEIVVTPSPPPTPPRMNRQFTLSWVHSFTSSPPHVPTSTSLWMPRGNYASATPLPCCCSGLPDQYWRSVFDPKSTSTFDV